MPIMFAALNIRHLENTATLQTRAVSGYKMTKNASETFAVCIDNTQHY